MSFHVKSTPPQLTFLQKCFADWYRLSINAVSIKDKKRYPCFMIDLYHKLYSIPLWKPCLMTLWTLSQSYPYMTLPYPGPGSRFIASDFTFPLGSHWAFELHFWSCMFEIVTSYSKYKAYLMLWEPNPQRAMRFFERLQSYLQ